MTLWQLVFKEIRFRKGGFVIGLISVAVAIGSLVGAITLLKAHDTRTEQILIQKEQETREEMARMEDDYRLIMRAMGHNVMILHKDESLATLRSRGHPSTTLPEDYVEKLGRGYVETLNHLLPVLQERMIWQEHDIEIILSGTPGQVPIYHKRQFLTADGTAYKSPIMEAVPAGTLIVGQGVARELGLKPGDTVTLMGEEFRIHQVNPSQGSLDDIMVWCNLEHAQRWLNREGKINAIFALECICHSDGLGQVISEVTRILPDTQVLEFSSRIVARAEARGRAREAREMAIESEMQQRKVMGEEQRAFAAILVPVVLAASGLWVYFLILGNVRTRAAEIGILRAIGVQETLIASVFLLKALLMGAGGAVVGYFAGVIIGSGWSGTPFASKEFLHLFSLPVFIPALVISLALCAVACWIPALIAARQDPAVVLREE